MSIEILVVTYLIGKIRKCTGTYWASKRFVNLYIYRLAIKKYTILLCHAVGGKGLRRDSLSLVGKWADPSGTAILGQPATKPEQAPELHPLPKISLISKGAHGSRIRY